VRIGINSGAMSGPETTFPGLIARARKMEALGFHSFWLAHIFGFDAITALAVVGQATERIELGTAVVPSYPRHPLVMAQQAATANAAAGGRFTLGIGLSHKPIIEGMFGLSYARPARHMAEYLQVLAPALRGEQIDHQGEQYGAHARIQVPEAPSTPLLVAALGERMLELAGTHADGTITWMTGPRTLEQHVIPKIRAAAAQAGRSEPRIVAGIPTAIVGDIDAARSRIDKGMAMYGKFDSYRGMLDREGAAGPADVAMIGDEAALRKQIQRFRDIGVTDLNCAILGVGDHDATVEFLAGELR